MTKVCNECQHEKPLTEFYVNHSHCKICKLVRSKRRYTENRDEILESQKAYQKQNRKAVLDYQKQYYADHKDEISLRNANYYKENKDYISERNRNWKQNNKEVINEYNRVRRVRLKDGVIGDIPKNIKYILLEEQSYICGICNEYIDVLFENISHEVHVDHITPVSRNGGHVVENLRATHGACNLHKWANID